MHSTRRSLLLAIITVAGAFECGIFRFLPGSATSGTPELATRLSRVLRTRYSAKVVGYEYLKRTDNKLGQTKEDLTRAVAKNLGVDIETLQGLSDEKLSSLLAAGICNDFKAENVVIVNGWVLALTEVRLCALTMLG